MAAMVGPLNQKPRATFSLMHRLKWKEPRNGSLLISCKGRDRDSFDFNAVPYCKETTRLMEMGLEDEDVYFCGQLFALQPKTYILGIVLVSTKTQRGFVSILYSKDP